MTAIDIKLSKSFGSISLQDSFTYDSAKPIGEGQLGIVYRAKRENDPAFDFVVKVPHLDSPEGTKELEDEYLILQQLWEKIRESDKNKAVPHAALGSTAVDRRPMLVMPLYHQQLSAVMREQISAGRAFEAEQLALKAIMGFADAMNALRRSEKTCTDRKTKDFFVHHDQPIVIDWNVLKPLDLDFYAAEVRLFGGIWYELLTGGGVPDDFNPFDDALWQYYDLPPVNGGSVSVGFRMAMVASVTQPTGNRFVNEKGEPDYRVLRDTLSRWQAVLNCDPTNTDRLTRLVSDYVQSLPSPPNTTLERSDAEGAVYTDVYWRLLYYQQNGEDNAPAFAQRTKALDQAQVERTARTFSYAYEDDKLIVQKVLEGRLSSAQNITVQHIEDAAQVQDWQIVGHKRRWQHLLTILDLLLTAAANATRERARDLILDVASKLSQSPDQDTMADLDAVEAQMNELNTVLSEENPDIRALPAPVIEEIALRRQAIKFRGELNLRHAIKQGRALLDHLQTIPYLTFPAESSATTRTLLADQIIPLGRLIAALNDVFTQLDQGEPLERYEKVLDAYHLTSALGEADLTWLDPQMEGYLQFTRFMIETDSTKTRQLALNAESVIQRASTLLQQTRIQSEEGLKLAVERRVVEVVRALYETFTTSQNSRRQRDAAALAQIARTLEASTIYADTVNEAFHNTNSVLEAEGVGSVWDQVLVRMQAVKALDAFYDDWRKKMLEISLKQLLENQADGASQQDRAAKNKIVLEFIQRAGEVGADMSEMIDSEQSSIAKQWRDLVESFVKQALDAAQNANKEARNATARAEQAAKTVQYHHEAIGKFNETLTDMTATVTQQLDQLVQGQSDFQEQQRAQIVDKVRAVMEQEKDDLTQQVSEQAVGIVARQVQDIKDETYKVDRELRNVVGAMNKEVKQQITGINTKVEAQVNGNLKELDDKIFRQQQRVDKLDDRLTAEVQRLRALPLEQQIQYWGQYQFDTPQQGYTALIELNQARAMCPIDAYTEELHQSWKRLMKDMLQAMKARAALPRFRTGMNNEYVATIEQWVNQQIEFAQKNKR